MQTLIAGAVAQLLFDLLLCLILVLQRLDKTLLEARVNQERANNAAYEPDEGSITTNLLNHTRVSVHLNSLRVHGRASVAVLR